MLSLHQYFIIDNNGCNCVISPKIEIVDRDRRSGSYRLGKISLDSSLCNRWAELADCRLGRGIFGGGPLTSASGLSWTSGFQLRREEF